MASIRIGSAFGIPVKLGTSFLLVVPLVAYLVGAQVTQIAEVLAVTFAVPLDGAALTGGLLPWLLGLAAALGLFASVLVHEFGHSLVARHYGLRIESITLWFLGGLAQFAELPDDWRHEFVIAIVGPLVSLALGVGLVGMFSVVPADFTAVRFVVGYLALLNVVLAVFNMLPGFPMDGGRVLRALLSRNRSRVRATRLAAQVGKGFAILLGLAGVLLFNIFWIVIAFFIFVAAASETQQVVLKAALEGVAVSDLMTPARDLDTVEPDATVADLLERMIRERHTGYPVVEDGNPVGIVTLEDVERLDPERRDDTTVGDVMSADLLTASPGSDAMEAISRMRSEDVGRLLVVDGAGDLVGLISRTDLMTVFEIIQTSEEETPERIATP